MYVCFRMSDIFFEHMHSSMYYFSITYFYVKPTLIWKIQNVYIVCLYLHWYQHICIWKKNKHVRDYDKYSWTSDTIQKQPIENNKKCKRAVACHFQFETNEELSFAYLQFINMWCEKIIWLFMVLFISW